MSMDWVWLRRRLAFALAVLLRERQVLVRANGRVSYLRLDGRRQAALYLAGLAAVGWLAYASIATVVHGERLAERAREVARAERAYAGLIGELATYQGQLGRAVDGLDASEAALRAALAGGGETALRARLEDLARERELLALARERLGGRLAGLRDELAAIAERRGGLDEEAAAVAAALEAGRRPDGGLARVQARLDARLAELEGALAEARAQARTRGRRAAELARALDASETGRRALAADHARLQEQLARLRRAREGRLARLGALEARAERLERELATAGAVRDRLARERGELAGEVARLRRDLTAARSGGDALRVRVVELSGALSEARAARRGMRDLLDGATAEMARLRGALTAARAGLAEGRAEADRLRAELAASEAERRGLERARALQRVRADRARAEAAEAERREAALDERLTHLQQALAAAGERGLQLAAERDRLAADVATLEGRIGEIRADHAGLLERLAERTALGIGVIETTVAKTGVDIEALVARVRQRHAGRGGPFVPLKAGELAAGPRLQDIVARLDRHIHRWTALQMAVGSLPLAAPLARYEVASGFGRRRDPINGRWAQHDGVDLSGEAGTPVFAAGPGEVVYAGWRGHYGRVVEIEHGYGIRTRYGHLRKVLVERGERVGVRRQVGLVGSSGRSTGPHVHYEVLVDGAPHDPLNFIEAGRHAHRD